MRSAKMPANSMRYVKDSCLELGFRVSQLRPPQPSLTIVVKGTFDPAVGDPAPFAEEQVAASGEAYWDDDVEQSLRAPSDFALLKPRGECFVVGKAWAPGGRPASVVACAFKIGPVEKTFAVFGDRRWSHGIVRTMSEPEPFTEMELRMERAFGGPRYAPNPYGRGRSEFGGELLLPNLEQTRDLVRSPSSRPEPVVIGPLPMAWPERMKHAGTYDQRYMRERWPWLPHDFDWRFYLEAPPDQQLNDGFWRGDEHIEIHNLHPTVPSIRSHLPGILPRLFVDLARPGEEPTFKEVLLKLDTVTWDAAIGKLLLTWRGLSEVPSETLDEVRHIFVAHDPLAGPLRRPSELRARFEALLQEEEDEERDAEGDAPPAIETPESNEEAAEESAKEEAGPSPEELELDAQLAALAANMKALGIEEPKEERAPAPHDLGAMAERLRASGTLTPELEELLAALQAPEEPAAEETEPPLPVSPPELTGRALVEARIAAGEPLTELDLTGADLAEMDLSGRDLSGSILHRVSLTAAKLVGTILRGCVLAESELVRAELGGATLTGADLHAANLQWADLLGASFEDASFEEARLVGARLQEAKGARATFARADLTQAVLVRGDFTEADFERAKLDRADLLEATLKDASFEHASAEGARFERAIMTKSRGAGLHAKEARFGAIDAEDSFWERAELSRASFSFARLTRADFTEATLIGTEMDGCAMRGARFDRANAHSLRARKSDLMEASFESAELSYADLRGASCFGAELWRAKTTNALFELTDLTRTKLEAG